MTETTETKKGHFRKNWLKYLMLVALVGISGYLWLSKDIALKKSANAFEIEKSEIISEAKAVIDSSSVSHLKMMMKTFVWAVRSEMIRGNMETVDQYFSQLVKSENIEEVLLVDKTGKILLSSNKKKNETAFPEELVSILENDQISVMDNVTTYVVSAPVMSLNSKLGTLVLYYMKDSSPL